MGYKKRYRLTQIGHDPFRTLFSGRNLSTDNDLTDVSSMYQPAHFEERRILLVSHFTLNWVDASRKRRKRVHVSKFKNTFLMYIRVSCL